MVRFTDNDLFDCAQDFIGDTAHPKFAEICRRFVEDRLIEHALDRWLAQHPVDRAPPTKHELHVRVFEDPDYIRYQVQLRFDHVGGMTGTDVGLGTDFRTALVNALVKVGELHTEERDDGTVEIHDGPFPLKSTSGSEPRPIQTSPIRKVAEESAKPWGRARGASDEYADDLISGRGRGERFQATVERAGDLPVTVMATSTPEPKPGQCKPGNCPSCDSTRSQVKPATETKRPSARLREIAKARSPVSPVQLVDVIAYLDEEHEKSEAELAALRAKYPGEFTG